MKMKIKMDEKALYIKTEMVSQYSGAIYELWEPLVEAKFFESRAKYLEACGDIFARAMAREVDDMRANRF